MMKTELPAVYNYNDFRAYLADYQKARHKIEPLFTGSGFSRLLGLPNTRSYFNDVIKGKVVSQTFVERFIQILNLRKEAAQFFRILVKFNQASNSDEREIYFEQLISLNRTPKKVLIEQAYIYYKHWYNSAIRALLDIIDFNGADFTQLAKSLSPAITVKQARDAIKLMVRLELIAKNKQGFYRPTDKSISTPDFVKSDLIKQHQMQCLDIAKKRVIGDVDQNQIIATNTISISAKGLKRLQKQIHSFRSAVRSLVHKDEDKAEKVYQIALTFFPLSK